MPIDVEICNDGAGVVLLCRGVLTAKDLIDVQSRFLASPELVKRIRYCIVDEMAVESVDLSSAGIQAVAEISKRLASVVPPGTAVCIAAPKDVAFGFARMWEVFAQETGWETMTVRSRTEANAWVANRTKEPKRKRQPANASPP